jgi:hypothetical protein
LPLFIVLASVVVPDVCHVLVSALDLQPSLLGVLVVEVLSLLHVLASSPVVDHAPALPDFQLLLVPEVSPVDDQLRSVLGMLEVLPVVDQLPVLPAFEFHPLLLLVEAFPAGDQLLLPLFLLALSLFHELVSAALPVVDQLPVLPAFLFALLLFMPVLPVVDQLLLEAFPALLLPNVSEVFPVVDQLLLALCPLTAGLEV